MAYCSPKDIRDRLAQTCTQVYPDAYVLPWIAWATAFIDNATGQWFEPRSLSPLKIDGRGTRTLLLPVPIIELTKLEFADYPVLPAGMSEVPLDCVVVYNRHLEGLTNPDDRANPKLAFAETQFGDELLVDVFPIGRQNIWMTGKFGYTEYDGGVTPDGITPPLIKDVCIRLVLREMPLPGAASGGGPDGAQYEQRMRSEGRVVQEKVRDQSITYAPPSAAAEGNLGGLITGDPYIDMILMRYKRPPVFVSA